MPDRSERDELDALRGALKTERASFDAHWTDLAEHVSPRRSRFFTADRNRGDKRHQSIINSVATQAHKIARAGMLAGSMSPSRPWHALEHPDPDLMEFPAVKVWLDDLARLQRAIFNSGNLYTMAPVMIGDALLFATGAMTHEDDFEDVARFYSHPVGSYYIAQDSRYVVDTFIRDYEMTTRQVVAEFGLENVSRAVRQDWDLGNYENWHPVTQVIRPNRNHDPTRRQARFKRFSSTWYELRNPDRRTFLRRSGFDEFPVYVLRWDVTGEDVYGTDCPAITSLGDIKGLQLKERRLAQAIDKLVTPPLKGPPQLRNIPIHNVSGGFTGYDDGGGTKSSFGPLYTVEPHVAELAADIGRTENRIKESFFVDLFLAISTMEGIQPRNELELSQRNAERLLQLGPVLERMYGDFQDRMIDRNFNQIVRAGILPPPPRELLGESLEVKYISSLAIAQRAVATQNIERYVAFVERLVGANLSDGMKLDADQAADEYAQAAGTPPRLVVPDEVVAERREQAQQMIEAQRALEMGQQGAGAVKDLADAGATIAG